MVRIIEDWESEIFFDTIAPLKDNPETHEALVCIETQIPARKQLLAQWSPASLLDIRQSVIDILVSQGIIDPDDSDVSFSSESVTNEHLQYIAEICAINEILYGDEDSDADTPEETELNLAWEDVRFEEMYHSIHVWENGKYVNITPQIYPKTNLKRHEQGWYEYSRTKDPKEIREIRNRIISELKQTFHLEAINHEGFVFNPPLSSEDFNNALARIAQLSGINKALKEATKAKDNE